MTWNYRIVEENGYLSLREVFYNKKGKIRDWTAQGIALHGETLADLVLNLQQQKLAFGKPTLVVVKNKLKEKKNDRARS